MNIIQAEITAWCMENQELPESVQKGVVDLCASIGTIIRDSHKEEIKRLTKELNALIKVINASVKDTAFPHKLYEALIDRDTRKMKPIGEIMELEKMREDERRFRASHAKKMVR